MTTNVICKICNQKFESCVIRTQRFERSEAIGLSETCSHCGLNTILAEDNLINE
ncbi:MAG: hypothetical protein ACFFAS_19800 [Promethearchaeota archaeon]